MKVTPSLATPGWRCFAGPGKRIKSFATTADTFRLVIAQARVKGWTGISIRGDETFLRVTTRVAKEEGSPTAGRDDAMEDVIRDEVLTIKGGINDDPPDPHWEGLG